jgi:hypothetical protein
MCFLLSPLFAFAQLSPQETGLEQTGEEAYGTLDQTVGEWVGSKVIVPAMSIVGVLFLILMIYAGFLWMTAGGKPDQTTKAKDMMIRAIIGVIIIAAAYAITNFVFTAIQ